MLLLCMICPARTRVQVTLADLRFFLPSASGRDGRIGCIKRCGASSGPPTAAALWVGLGSGSGLLARPTSATYGQPNGGHSLLATGHYSHATRHHPATPCAPPTDSPKSGLFAGFRITSL